MNYHITKTTRKVRKSNALINAREKVSLSALEQKLILFSITELDGAEPSRPLTIEFQDFFGERKLKSSQYRDLRKACKSVASAMVAFEQTDDKGEVQLGEYVPVFGKIVADNMRGELTFEFNSHILPHITDLKKNFTSYLYRNVAELKSAYAIRIYELLQQGVDRYASREFSVEELKEILGIAGLKTYEKFGKFRQTVLDKACAEITEKTDMDVSWEEAEKQRNKITAIRFLMNLKQPAEKVKVKAVEKAASPSSVAPKQLTIGETVPKTFTFESEKHRRLHARLLELELSSGQAMVVVKEVGVEGETGIWKLVNEIKMGVKDGKVTSVKSYTLKLLKDRYQLSL
ncbi:replication initiation protein [Limibacter armeniacum]|uniref:replication initiation protein n=1 Tax=Limibacter armeniacum TaxID=466084 RepID=UPI002FE57EDA